MKTKLTLSATSAIATAIALTTLLASGRAGAEPVEPSSDAATPPPAGIAPPPSAPPGAAASGGAASGTTPVVVTPAAGMPVPVVVAAAPKKPGMLDDQHFRVDPIADTTIIVMGLGFAGINELILSTGEIRPQRPVDPSQLLGIDRGAVSQKFDSNAAPISTAGLYTAVGFALLDPILSGFRNGTDAAVVDAVIYAESLSLTLALTDLAKIAVRRPRPSAYVAQAQLDKEFGANAPSITDTDQSLSFFSGHAATTATIAATATYLAFRRSPHSLRPWITLALGTLLTAGVSFERVRAGAHFPTDVITGAIAGASIGVAVPHLHLHDDDARTIWIGMTPVPSGLGLGLQGRL